MTQVLVVHHDVDLADVEVDGLRRAGYEVRQCIGPVGEHSCPVMHGERCWMADEADVLVYDAWASTDLGRQLVEDIRALYPDKPIVITSSGLPLDWEETEGPTRVTPLTGAPTRERLTAAVEAALHDARDRD
jgi:DNA-binding NtrC family response regulator